MDRLAFARNSVEYSQVPLQSSADCCSSATLACQGHASLTVYLEVACASLAQVPDHFIVCDIVSILRLSPIGAAIATLCDLPASAKTGVGNS